MTLAWPTRKTITDDFFIDAASERGHGLALDPEQARYAPKRMTHRLSLHHLTILDTAPAELIRIAGELKCHHVCLFVHVPPQIRARYPVVEPEDANALRNAMSRAGVTLYNCEVFPLDGETPIASYEPPLALAAALGAGQATVHVHSGDRSAATDQLRRFCDLARDQGMNVGLAFNAFSRITSPTDAASLAAAAARSNLNIVLDVLHAMRSGEGMAGIRSIAPFVRYGQLCDGPMQIPPGEVWGEALSERALPGAGAFPLRNILAPLSRDIVWDVETPQRAARMAGVSPLERARGAVEAARAVLSSVDRD